MSVQPGMAEDSGSGSESEFEEEEPTRGGKKRGRGGGRAMQAAKRSRQNSDLPVTLFEVVRQGRMAMTAIVDDWIEAYKAERNEALLDLIQFFINASGCKGTVTPEMLRDASEGFQDVIKRMTEEFDEDSGDYPMIASGPNFKKFRSNFSDFVQALVRQCQYQIIYDQFMMDNVLTLLTELSNSQVRAFRHTSTLAAMKLMTALVNVALQLSVSLDNTQRQYESERNKSANKRASEKLDNLLEKRKDLEDQQTEIESMLNGIFKGIFVHRYRDFIAEIRALCMEEIGVWMKMFPKVFLTDSYLKYVGWTLHDKQKDVRAKCLHTLQGLYRDDEMTKDLKLFTSRFKDRIVSMTLDKETDVAVLAIRLLILIVDHCGYDTPVLSSSDAESVYQLVFSVHRPVAVAAAEFLNKQLFTNKEVAPGYTKRGRRRSPNAPLITDLVVFFIESELHVHATYLVDSLWDAAPNLLKDFDCMTDLLLEEPANDRDQLDPRQEHVLVDIMVSSVKQAANGTPPTGRGGNSKKLAVRDKRVVLEDRVRLTEHFIVALPALLNKYQVDKEKVTMLLQIPRYFDLELYTTSRLEKHLEMLLRQIGVIIDKHTDSDLLVQASMTYHTLCDNDYTMCSKAKVERQTVVDSWAENFNMALAIFKDAISDASSRADDEEIYNVVQALKRLAHIYMHNNITSCDLYPSVYSILQMYQEKSDSVPEDMLDQAVKFIHYDLSYNLGIIREQEDSSQSGAADQRGVAKPQDIAKRREIAKLRQSVTDFMRSCQDLLSQSPHPKVKEACYMAMGDLFVLFAPQLALNHPDLRPLIQRPSATVQHLFVDFVNTYVFITPEDDDDDEEDTSKIDALHHRRVLLATISKLFIFNMFELKLAAPIFQQYIRFYPDYGDIIKEIISKSRHLNKMECARTILLSLMTLYRDTVRLQGGSLDHSSQEYGHMKELARRLSLTFGLDQVKTRDAVGMLHKEGIIFALKRSDELSENIPPENLSFLSILVEFSSKLMRQDRKTVVNYLDKHIKPHMLRQQTAGWIPLVTYRNSLIQGSDEADTNKQQAKGRRGRKKKNPDGDMDAPPTPMNPATPMSPGTPMTPMNIIPQHTSTVQRDAADQMRMDGSSTSYQAPEKNDLQSWLDTGKDKLRTKKKPEKNKKHTKKADSIQEEFTTPRGVSTRSMFSSIFPYDSQESSQAGDIKDLDKKMKFIQVKDVPRERRSKRLKDARKSDNEEERSRKKISKKDTIHPGSHVVSDFEEEDDFIKKIDTSQEDEEFHDAVENPPFFDVEIPDPPRNKRKATSKITDANDQDDFKDPPKVVSDKENLLSNASEKRKTRRTSAKLDTFSDVKNDKEKKKKLESMFDEDAEENVVTSRKDTPKKMNKDKSKPTTKKTKNRAVFSYEEDETVDDDFAEGMDIGDQPGEKDEDFEKDFPKKKVLLKKGRSSLKTAKKTIGEGAHQRESDVSEGAQNLPLQEKSSTNRFFKTTVDQNVTIDDVEIDEMFGFWDDNAEEESKKEKNSYKKDSTVTHSKNNKDTSAENKSKKNIHKKSDMKNYNENVTPESFTATNPFAEVTKAIQDNTHVGRKNIIANIQSDYDESDLMSEESLSDIETNDKLTQKSSATVRTHISDVDVMDMLFDDDDENRNQKEDDLFGAFTGVIRDVHSQSSQNIQSLNSELTQKSKYEPLSDFDDLLSSDGADSDSDNENPFANALRSARYDAKNSRPVISPCSPFSSDGEDDNFASMFGFGKAKKKETTRKRQANLIGSTMMTSPGHSMMSPVHQAPEYLQQMHQRSGYQMQGNMPHMPGQQQQFVVPGQYQQQQGYQMPMQSPGHIQQQPGMQGQSFYGS